MHIQFSLRFRRLLKVLTVFLLMFGTPSFALALPDLKNLLDTHTATGGGIMGTPTPHPLGPPLPTEEAEGKLAIYEIHKELARIYRECIKESNATFEGDVTVDVRPNTHDHLNCPTCKLKAERDWRCSPGIGFRGTDWCNDVERTFEKTCRMPSLGIEGFENNPGDDDFVEGFFGCEIENEWFVRLDNYFHYELDFDLGISRDLYQTAEIRVYCDGWEPTHVGGGTIKVVQLLPRVAVGPKSKWELITDTFSYGLVSGKVEKGLREQYTYSVPRMQHIIDVERLSGARCTSLGIDGDDSMPLEERNIIWDVPPPSDGGFNPN